MNATDHALAILKAGLNAVPIVGGSIASLIGDYIPSSTQRALQAAVEELKERLAKLENRIDAESVDREQFAELFKSSYLILVRTHDPRRRHAVVALITNALLRDGDSEKLPFTELDHFVRCLEILSTGALDVVKQAVSMARERRSSHLDKRSFRFSFGDLETRFSDTDEHLLLGLVGELNAVNLIHQLAIPTVRHEANLYGNYPLELTPLGARFVERLVEG